MEAAVVWEAAMKPRLPTRLGKRFAFPTAPTAPATGEKQARRTSRDAEGNLQNLTYTTAGEPYLDSGYRLLDETSSTGNFMRDASGAPMVKNAADRQWDYQDLAWSNIGGTGAGGGTKNGGVRHLCRTACRASRES